ncbi:MAG: helix-hairpin-helix domain-containing protein [Lachnospiraceae bacterium]|nr:helix-hairpin-helix domain-containing protein [Lachnospiraceae bacterium]
MKNIYLYICSTVISVCICISMSGCAAKDSGLYRVSVEASNEEIAGGSTGDVIEDSTWAESEGSGEDDAAQASAEETTVILEEEDAAPAVIYVHVCGAVNDPGVYEMKQGDRIFNAVDAAKGFTDDAATDYVNLAQVIADGMKITIPTVTEAEKAADDASAAIEYADTGIDSSTAQPTGHGEGAAPASQAAGSNTDGLIDINTADEAALTSITGIGPTRAKAIIAYREEHGGFDTIEDIRNVSGIGDSTFNKMKDEIRVK